MEESLETKPNILILAAHPDDEIVGCATAISRAKQQGATLSVLFLTTGCIARETRWPWDKKNHDQKVERRWREAEKTASFLGFSLLSKPTRPSRMLCCNLPAAHAEIQNALSQKNYGEVWCPAYEGGHADHDALNALAQTIKTVPVFEYAEYNFADRTANANLFPHPNGTEHILVLDANDQALKKQLLKFYESEQKNLSYVKTAQESFRPLAQYDYSKPAHPGTLWYTRFHWVPFRHPRIDFAKPEEFCAAAQHFYEKRI